jgi:predicted CxxxxCH...CXXCH cytochrome family protein
VAGTGDQTSANPKVGAHAAHLAGGTYSSALACSSCHAVPAQTFPASLAHLDGSADVEFSTTARKGVTNPAYAGAGGSCNVYCHGSTAALGNRQSPAWTSSAPLTCDSCHPSMPTSGEHQTHYDEGLQCSQCHWGYSVGSSPKVNLSTHVNGVVNATRTTWVGCNCH